ncbi:MAG: HAD family hydrolase [Candidatus Neomarinimicrobiota bacterium]|nr:MAG: HAD family hydrolase [Candidatus Neomarinimicrobiota bacterium]
MKYEMIFLDRDGTLNPDPGYIAALADFRFYPFTLPALEKLKEFSFCIVTNQSGVGRGIIDPDRLEDIHRYIRSQFEQHGLDLKQIYVCTDHPDRATPRRKPGTGMFLEAAREFGLDLRNCIMIGDAVSDILAGQSLGMDTMLVQTGLGKETLPQLVQPPTFVVKNLLEGASLLASRTD